MSDLERRTAEEDRASHLRFLESLDLVNRAMQGTSDLERMLSDVLDVVVAVFGCDRAWLIYPCDPATASYRVPMERTRPEYPGALARGLELPVDPETARVLEALRSSPGPVAFGPGQQQPLPKVLAERFQVQSQIAVAVHPRVSRPYAFGLHQCSYRRAWTDEDAKLLLEIGRRLGDALTSLQAFRDLEVSEGRNRTLLQRIQAAVVVHGADGRILASNRKAQELLGLSEGQLLGKEVADPGWRFFRPDGSVVPPEEYPARRVCTTREPVRDLVARIHRPAVQEASDVWVLVAADPVFDRDGELSQVVVTFSDVTSQKRAEERLRKEVDRGSFLLDLFLRSPEMSEKQVYDGVLDLAVRLTGSTIGFLHRVSEDQGSIRLTAWNAAALETCTAVFDEHYPIGKAGNWADCVRLGRPVIYNDFASSPNQKGLPPGHAPLRRFLSVPVVENGLVQAVFGVGNKEEEYDEGDVFQVQQVTNELQKLIRQRHAVERVQFLGRLYRTVSEMNQVIVREKDRDRLFAEVCRIGVEHGGFAMAWAGLVDRPGGTVRPAASAGVEAAYADELSVRLDAPADALRPAARAVVENRAVVVEDTEADPGFAPWRDEARRRGFRSCAAFPVRADGLVLGVLAVYAGEVAAFHGEVAALLTELAADLGFTLRALETEEHRARAERALRTERGLFVGGPSVVFTWKAEEGWPVEYVSPNVREQLGYAPEDFTTGRIPYAAVVHPDDLVRVGAEVSAYGEQGVPSFEQTYRVRRADGEFRWVRDFTTVRRDEDGEIRCYHGYVLDVTEHRRAEDALRESEQKYRALAESSPENIIRYDADGRMVYVNANLARTVAVDFAPRLGTVPEEELPGLPDHGAYMAKLRRVLRTGEPDELEMEVTDPGGSMRTHSVLFVAERSDDGRVVGALAFGRDVTEKKEADRERQRYLLQLRRNLEDAVAAIAATVEARDPYTAGHQKRVADVAAGIARELGLDEETVQAIHLAGTIHDLGKIKIPAEILARPGGLSPLEARLVRIHPEAGWEILKGIDFPWPIAEIVLQHHERLDGSGYPRGLRGEAISLGARILAVADVVEAMASHRPYRPSRGLAYALAVVEEDQEGCFDRAIVGACLRLFREKGYQLRE